MPKTPILLSKVELKKNAFSGIKNRQKHSAASPTPAQMKFDESKMIHEEIKCSEILPPSTLIKGEFPVRQISFDSSGIEQDMKPGISITDYYNLDNPAQPTPLPLESIGRRIAERCEKTDILTNKIMLDIFFLHQNWHIYKRGDGFQDYVKNHLPIGKSYVYDILKGVKLLTDYANHKLKTLNGTDETSSQDMAQSGIKMLQTLSEPVEKLGITKLRIIAQFPNDQKFALLEKSMSENISRITLEKKLAEIQEHNRSINEKMLCDINDPQNVVMVQNNEIRIGSNGAVIRLTKVPVTLKNQLITWIRRNYTKYIAE